MDLDSISVRRRPSDRTPVVFWGWVVLLTLGLALIALGTSPAAQIGACVIGVSSAIASPASEFKRPLRPSEYVLAIVLVVILALVILAQVFMPPSFFVAARPYSRALLLLFRVCAPLIWAFAVFPELRRFRQLRAAAAA